MVTITVTGPGGNISFEMILIRELLQREGYIVEVVDDHPFIPGDRRCSSFASLEEYLEHRRKLLAESPGEITLVARHQPWGG